MRANKGRRSTDDGSLLDGLAARAHYVVEVGLQTAVTLALVTRLLAEMLTALETLVARDTADMVSIGIGGVEERGTASVVANVFAASLLTTASTLASKGCNEFVGIGVNIAALHGLGSSVATAWELDFDLAGRALSRVTRVCAAMATLSHLVANGLARGNVVETGVSGHAIGQREDRFGTATAGFNEIGLKLAGFTWSNVTSSFALVITTVESTIAYVLAREETRGSRRGIFTLVWGSTCASGSSLATVTSLLDLLGAWRARTLMAEAGTAVTTAGKLLITNVAARLSIVVLSTSEPVGGTTTPAVFEWAHRGARRARTRMALKGACVRARCSRSGLETDIAARVRDFHGIVGGVLDLSTETPGIGGTVMAVAALGAVPSANRSIGRQVGVSG
jgi:hypothetical protein